MAVTSPQEQIIRKESDNLKLTLKQWRRLKDITQEELAERVGKTAVTISKWEQGHTEPKMSDMDNLRKALELKASDSIVLPERSTLI